MNGFAELGICVPLEMCESLCNFFNEELGKPDSRHTVVNGNRALLIVHPSTNKDPRMLDFIAWVSHMMTVRFPTEYLDIASVIITEIQFLLNRKGFDWDQDRHVDSLMNNLVATFMLQTGYPDDENGTLTLMSPSKYEDFYELSPELLKKHDITLEEWQKMLVDTITRLKHGLSHEGISADTTEERLRMFSVTEKERGIWIDLLIANGLTSSDGIPLSEEDMDQARVRNKDGVGAGVLFYSNRSHFGAGNQQNCRDKEDVVEDIKGRLVLYVAFDSASEGPSKADLQSTSLVIFVKALQDKLLLDGKSCRREKRSTQNNFDEQNTAVKLYYEKRKSIYPIRSDGNCLCGSVREGLRWLLCHIRDTKDIEAYENCDVYKKIEDVVASDEGVFMLRKYALDELEKEFSHEGDGVIEYDSSDYSAASLRVKLLSSLINIEGVSTVSTVTKVVIGDYIKQMRVDKKYGDVTLLLALQMLLRPYARISKCQVGNDGAFSEELDPLETADSLFTIRLLYYHKPSSQANEAHYDLIMDCNWDLRAAEFLSISKKMWYYVHICSRCFWNSKRFCIKDTPSCGKGLFAVNTFEKGSIVTIYPIAEVAFSRRKPIDIVSLSALQVEGDFGQHTYLLEGMKYNNAADVHRFIKDDAAGNYVPQGDYAGMDGLAFFINSDYEDEVCNCKMSSVEVWVPLAGRVVKFKCVTSIRDIQPGEQFIVPYNMDRRNNIALGKEAFNEKKPGRPSKGNRPLINVGDAVEATKNFESGVKNIPAKRERKSEIVVNKRKSPRAIKVDELHVEEEAIEESEEPKNKKRRGRGPGKKRKEESEDIKHTVAEQIKKEKEKKPRRNPKVEVAGVLSPEVVLVRPEVVPADTELELKLAKEKAESQLQQAMKAQSDEHEKILQIQTFESNAAHQAAISDLNALHQLAIAGLNTGHQVAISELRAILNGCDIKIEALQDQLHPYLQGSRHTQMMSEFRERDLHQITDARVANYYSDMNLCPPRTPFSQRGQPSTQPAIHPPQTQPALLPSPILRAVLPAEPQLALPPPLQPAVLPVVTVPMPF